MPDDERGNRPNRPLRKTLIGAGLAVAATLAGVSVERYLIRRARSRPDPERGEPLSIRPGKERGVTSFDGTELAVTAVGPQATPTLVFIHGFSLDMTVWHYQWKRFSRDHRCVLYDQRGHGESAPAAGGDYSLDALGHDLKAVLDAEAPSGPVVLIGHSMGGMAVMSFAALYPEEFGQRVHGAVLANTAAAEVVKEVLGGLGARIGSFVVPGARPLAGRLDRVHRIRTAVLTRSPDLAFLAVQITNFGPKAPPSMVDYVGRVAAQARPEVWSDLVASLAQMDLAHALQHITVPTLVLVGDVDRLTPPSTALAIRRRLPKGRMVVLRGAGHCAMLERHAQFNRVLERFLEEALRPAKEAARA